MVTKAVFFLITILLLTSVASVSAQKKVVKSISAGVLNGRALSLPKPEYPVEALKAKLTGKVTIQVVIDETGNVISAKAIKNLEHVSLCNAAEVAALKAKFSPTTLSGRPVKVTGTIEYNFVAESSNEEKLKVLGVATFLSVLRAFASDLEKTEEIFETKDLVKETLSDFPKFAVELSPLTELKGLSVSKRLEVIDKAFAAIASKLDEPQKWQLEVGRNLGDIFGYTMNFMASADGPGDLYKLDDASIKLKLNTIRDLTLSTPQDFPRDVLQKVKALCALSEKETLATPEAQKEFIDKIGELVETISPEATK